MVAPSGGAFSGSTPSLRINDHAAPRYNSRPCTPSCVARVKKACSSSVVSKVFHLFVHLLDEVLVVFDVEIHDILIPVGPSAFEIVL